MSAMIGPTFEAEIHAAGLAGLAFAWGPDGVVGLDALTPEQRAAVQAVVNAHDPTATPPPASQGAAFAGVMFRNLAGADAAAQLARGVALLGQSPRALGFINLLDVPEPSAARCLVLRGLWAAIKADPVIGIGGSDPAALTAAECAAIEVDGRDHFGIDLAG